MSEALLLVGHGSRDARAAPVAAAVAEAIDHAPDNPPATAAFLELSKPSTEQALSMLAEAGTTTVRIVPFLLSHAYHSTTDLPRVADHARGLGLSPVLGTVLGPDPLLIDALVGRLQETATRPDHVVLAAAGSSHTAANAGVARMAADLSERLGIPTDTAFASAAGPTVDAAVGAARRGGAEHVVVATYLLAPGYFSDHIACVARGAGAVAVSEPLGVAGEIVELVRRRTSSAIPL